MKLLSQLLFMGLVILSSQNAFAVRTDDLNQEHLNQAKDYLNQNYAQAEEITFDALQKESREKPYLSGSTLAVISRDAAGNLKVIEGTFIRISSYERHSYDDSSVTYSYIVLKTQSRGDTDVYSIDIIDLRIIKNSPTAATLEFVK